MGIIFIFQAPKIVNREIFRIFTSIYYFKNNTFDGNTFIGTKF